MGSFTCNMKRPTIRYRIPRKKVQNHPGRVNTLPKLAAKRPRNIKVRVYPPMNRKDRLYPLCRFPPITNGAIAPMRGLKDRANPAPNIISKDTTEPPARLISK